MTASDVHLAWSDWVLQMGTWDLFGTLTYRDQLTGSKPHPEAVERHIRQWLRTAPKTIGRNVEAAVVGVERHRSSWPHAHALLRLPGGVHQGDLVGLGQAWFAAHGFARLELPRSKADVVEYVCKYVTKDLDRGDVLFWPPRGVMTTHQLGLR